MSVEDAVPLGFSDLTEDEALIIALFREWRRVGPTRTVAEHKIACLLQRSNIYGALDALFTLFLFIDEQCDRRTHTHDVLSAAEEELLSILSHGHRRSEERVLAIIDCRDALQAAGVTVRPAASIARSGQDRTAVRVAQSYVSMLR